MEIKLAKQLAEQLMAQHGIHSWIVVFDNAKTRKGQTRFRRQEISLSTPLTEFNPVEQVRNTILHEIAHVLVGEGHGHDETWRFKAIQIGCTGQTCTPVVNRIPGRYTIKCNNCGESIGEYYRRPKIANCWHLKCGRASINKLEIVINS
jgi:predicted SprT family Zn-dependent metalloprotease